MIKFFTSLLLSFVALNANSESISSNDDSSIVSEGTKLDQNQINELNDADKLITETTEKGSIDEAITQAVNNAQPPKSIFDSTPQEDLKKIEEEFDLGETTNENTPDTSKIDITPQSIPSKKSTIDTPATTDLEEDIDLETLISANYFSKAIVLVTNKITAKSQLLTINVDSSSFYGNIEIFPLKCWKSPNKYNPESKAFIKVIERKIDDESRDIFSGWLFSSSISLSTMEHPIYEISIVDCSGEKLSINKK
ncbi:MAG: hypothetical protein K0Q51_100 [Rickettsiaceae bacterium]|jgi:hypothetical protein|nr:hypothetical protein [Rickettsiaceae bacterium]